MNITLTGFMASGKTTVGRRLAKRLGWTFVDLDERIVAAARKPIARIFAEHGEPVFRRFERREVARAVRGCEQVIATGGGAFVDPVNRARLKAAGPVIALTADPKTIYERVKPTIATRPLLAADPSPARIRQLMQQRATAYAKADLTIDTTGLSVDEIVERIWDAIGPWISKSWQYLVKHSAELGHRYGGKYVVVCDDHIVAAGETQLKAYQAIRRPVSPECEIGIYYVPLREELPLAL
jgi:shikimate kinase